MSSQTEQEECANIQTKNFYYWLYKITRDQIQEDFKTGITTEHKDYHWNRWMIKRLANRDLNNYSEVINELQKNINEATPSFVKNPIRLADIQKFSSEEEKSLLNSMKERSSSTDSLTFTDGIIDFSDIPEWSEEVKFDDFIFPLETNFKESKFKNHAYFRRCIFFKKVLFDKTVFQKNAYFTASIFSEMISFLKVKFATGNNLTPGSNEKTSVLTKVIYFLKEKVGLTPNASYEYDARFIETIFFKKTSFFNAEFHGSVLFFGSAFFGDINRFIGASFSKSPFFYGAIFKNPCNLANCTLDTLPNFTGCEFRGGFDITGIEFKDRHGWKMHQSSKEKEEDKYSLRNEADIKNGNQLCVLFIERQKDEITKEDPEKQINYKAARHSLQLLRDTAKKNDDTQNELKYIKWEFDIALKDPNEPTILKFILICYKYLSNYGTSIFRPIIFCVIKIAFFGLLFCSLSITINDSGKFPPTTEPSPFQYSLFNSIVFVPISHRGYYQNLFENTFGEPVNVKAEKPNNQTADKQDAKAEEPNNLTADKQDAEAEDQAKLIHLKQKAAIFISYLQKLFSLILLFLLSLAIRNRLKLR
ncbi:hypothetical protein [Nitrosomonas sp.]|uniref:hypothetical protein n=1 Tax=Nitrosomonas sp. TaxID=42353 RepID=UPI00207FAC4A|nr:hypothetical protein [Nitrosomonas sp.]GJL73970.1 MAG: hypothetical protein NMNS02_00760 [Nitrosomonas sp.]